MKQEGAAGELAALFCLWPRLFVYSRIGQSDAKRSRSQIPSDKE
jgi:hypothetical protein